MKKNLLAIILLLLSATSIFATGIDVNYAMQVAQNFYLQTTGRQAVLTLAYKGVTTNPLNGNLHLADVPVYYAFNAGHNQGFVIVAADNAVKPIIGYSTNGRFAIEKAPVAITGWLEKYSKQIAFAKVNLTAVNADITAQWTNYYNNISSANGHEKTGAVAPLVNTTWDQGQYYNALCPSDFGSPGGYDGHVPTGCGATAMAQIMRYWGYPNTGTGSHSYNSGYGTLSANFGATTYNWANMPNSVTNYNNDVATLMYQCGVAVEMNYETLESLSYMTGQAPSCQTAYVTYFGYDPGIQGLQRGSYTDQAWASLIQTELANGRPVQYAGSGPDGGHTFVLDGADGNGNFHINWGWGGTDNGFYSVNALDPSPYPNGTFDQNESMVIGIKPLNVTVVTSGISLFEAIAVAPSPIPFLQTFTVTTNLVNDGTAPFDGAYCAALFDASGNFIRYVGDILNTNGSALGVGYHYSNSLTFNDTTQAVTVPGDYTVGIFYKPTGSNTWSLAGASTYTNPVTVTVTGPQDEIDLYSDITLSPTTFVQGQPATAYVNLTNAGNTVYTGQYEAVLLDLEGNFVEQIGTYTESQGLQVNYVYNQPLAFTTNNLTAPEGQYILAIAENRSGTQNWYYCGGQTYKNPILVNVVNPGINYLAIDEVPAAGALKIYPDPARDKINIDAGNAAGNYTLRIFDAVGRQVNESNGILSSQPITADVSAFATGIYVVQLKTEAGTFNSKFVVK